MSKHWQVKQVTRSDFTHEEITNALIKCGNHLSSAAKELSKLGKGKVSRQLLRYWVNSEDFAEEVKSPHYEAEQHIAKVRAQNNAKSLRRQVKQLSEVALVQQEWEETIRRSVKRIVKDLNEPTFEWVTTPESSKNITVEILISDLQIGKLTSYYNTGVALRRLTEVGVKARQAIKQKQELGYNVERIVLAFLGDIIESDEKHADSARACDSSTSEQMSDAIRGIYERVIRNVVDLSPRVDCIGVAG